DSAKGEAAVPGPDVAAPDHSGTNTHEAGVDEPDLVKTDGKRIVTMSGDILRVIDAASRRVTGTLALGDLAEANLLLSGDHALVLTTTAPIGLQVGGRVRPVIATTRLMDADDRR